MSVDRCLLNVVSMFHVLELERKWRIENDLPTGFGSLSKFKPTVAVGRDRPLEEEEVYKADYFRKFLHIYIYALPARVFVESGVSPQLTGWGWLSRRGRRPAGDS